MQRTLLIDSDIVAYKFAFRHQKETAFGTALDEDLAREQMDVYLAELLSKLNADRLLICLSDSEKNWRNDVYPEYKSNRINVKRPELLSLLKDYFISEYETYVRDSLEADDIMGILATHPKLISGEKIVVSEDKDLRTVPCKLFNPGRPKLGVIEISELDADRFHMWQTVTGDVTDGYPGCPGMGKESEYVKDILFSDRQYLWGEVLGAYSLKGKAEKDAIVQARVARILRAEDYDFKQKKVIPWEPLLVQGEEFI